MPIKVTKQKVKGILKMVAMVGLMIWCIESGYFLFYMLGLMAYGVIMQKEIYKTYFSWYKGAIKKAWKGEQVEVNAGLPGFLGQKPGVKGEKIKKNV